MPINRVDKEGLIIKGDSSIRDGLEEFARDDWKDNKNEERKKNLEEIVEWSKPTVLIGTSTQPGAFSVGFVRLQSKRQHDYFR